MIPLAAIAAYLLTGAVAGFFAGLLGVGGGVVVVPVLTMVFAAQGFPANEVLHLALGTSMATILFTSLSSLRAHHAHQAVLWPVMRRLTPGILAGTLLGAQLAARISSRALSIFFVAFMLMVAFQMVANLRPKPTRSLPGRAGLGVVGGLIGAIASLAAMGGGALTVPYLIWCNVRPHQAIGTSAAVGLPIALGGTVGYVWNGWPHPELPAGSLGFVYLPALAVILLASVMMAPMGARLAHRLPIKVLKRIFAGLLLLLSAKMLWSLYG
ncbi:sulfite exporter TauE/SafE family protein [Dechloromonas sp. XY25]|uniref:Probable membrane transporter protein n=1 Tax=Dechloromonas hankyongensis TaxID=2908002 RepID=A0ABS9JXQ5_9RHOO|nr:sulfite exporter TauE/SafE family protein [Dechloromonas hankyongensis]MCG2575619.1 sulfite exporter TauE/SafE family protein [Dechloromonas hankyongensis]